jgi:hypothetical protein
MVGSAMCKAFAKIEVGIGMSEKELRKRLTDAECRTLFASLFPAGFAGKDVLEEIAPEGWPDSTLQFVFHPILEHVHWERVQLHRHLRNWPWFPKDQLDEPEPTREDVPSDYKDSPVDTTREVRELVAMCLCGADQLNRESGEQRYDCMDSYMGTFLVSERADLTSVYETIFRR